MINQKLNSNNNNRDIEAIRIKLYVKYMVCLRDKLVLQSALNKLGLKYRISIHGAILFLEEVSQVQYHELKMELAKADLILLDHKNSMLIDRIINTVIEVIHYTDTLPDVNFTDFVSNYAGEGNDSILKIFSDVKGMSVLQFINIQKIERAKELMLYSDMTLQEISELLNFKSQDKLIAKFEEIAGLSPLYFKQLKKERNNFSDKFINATHAIHSTTTGTNS